MNTTSSPPKDAQEGSPPPPSGQTYRALLKAKLSPVWMFTREEANMPWLLFKSRRSGLQGHQNGPDRMQVELGQSSSLPHRDQKDKIRLELIKRNFFRILKLDVSFEEVGPAAETFRIHWPRRIKKCSIGTMAGFSLFSAGNPWHPQCCHKTFFQVGLECNWMTLWPQQSWPAPLSGCVVTISTLGCLVLSFPCLPSPERKLVLHFLVEEVIWVVHSSVSETRLTLSRGRRESSLEEESLEDWDGSHFLPIAHKDTSCSPKKANKKGIPFSVWPAGKRMEETCQCCGFSPLAVNL